MFLRPRDIIAGGALLVGALAAFLLLRSEPAKSEPPKNETVVTNQDVEQCVAALKQRASEDFRVVREVVSPEDNGKRTLEPNGVSLVSRGPHSPEIKIKVRRLLSDLMDQRMRQLREAQASNNLGEEASLKVANEQLKVQMKMLEDDDYLVLDKGGTDKIWPKSPTGWIIYKTSSYSIDGGKTETVFPIRLDKYSEILAAQEHSRQVEDFLAMDAAYKFNGYDDSRRAMAVAAIAKLEADRSVQLSEEEQQVVVLIETARRDGRFGLDRGRMMLTPR